MTKIAKKTAETTKIVETESVKKKRALELIKGKQMLYLIFRKFNDNYYIANHISKLPENRTPTDSLVCEITESSEQVEKDKLLLSILPKKLPDYIINGFKDYLIKDVKKSLTNDYKAFNERECNFWELEDDVIEIANAFKEAKQPLLDIVNSLSNIEDFFRFAMLLQNEGSIKIYLLDLWKVKA